MVTLTRFLSGQLSSIKERHARVNGAAPGAPVGGGSGGRKGDEALSGVDRADGTNERGGVHGVWLDGCRRRRRGLGLEHGRANVGVSGSGTAESSVSSSQNKSASKRERPVALVGPDTISPPRHSSSQKGISAIVGIGWGRSEKMESREVDEADDRMGRRGWADAVYYRRRWLLTTRAAVNEISGEAKGAPTHLRLRRLHLRVVWRRQVVVREGSSYSTLHKIWRQNEKLS